MSAHDNASEFKSYSPYIIGFILSIISTSIAFGVVMNGGFSGPIIIWTILIMAVARIFTHLKFFLHLGIKTEEGKINTIALLFATLIMVMMVGLSIWVIFESNAMMMY